MHYVDIDIYKREHQLSLNVENQRSREVDLLDFVECSGLKPWAGFNFPDR